MTHQLVHTNLKQITRGRVLWRLAKRFTMPAKRTAPPRNLRIGEVGEKIMRESIADLRNDPQVRFDCLAN